MYKATKGTYSAAALIQTHNMRQVSLKSLQSGALAKPTQSLNSQSTQAEPHAASTGLEQIHDATAETWMTVSSLQALGGTPLCRAPKVLLRPTMPMYCTGHCCRLALLPNAHATHLSADNQRQAFQTHLANGPHDPLLYFCIALQAKGLLHSLEADHMALAAESHQRCQPQLQQELLLGDLQS